MKFPAMPKAENTMPDSDAGLSEEQIFARCSSHSWHRLHRETDCPQDQIASAEILKGWLRPGTPGAGEAIQAANKLLNALNMKPHPNALAVARVFDLKITGHYWFFKEKDRLIATPFMELPDGKMSSDTGEGWTVEAVHRHWKIHNNNPDEFPLMPLVSAWHQRPEHLPVPDYTDNARVVGMTQARATSAQLTESREARIAAMELCTSTRGTLPLFQSTNLHAPPDPRLSVPLIDLWDLHRFPILSRGRRASLEAIFIVKFTAVMMAARNRDENKPVAMTLEELILLLWPKDGNLRLKQRWPRIREMLMRLQTTVLRFADGTAWPFVTLMGTAIPEIWTDGTPDKEAIAVFRVSWPPGTGRGRADTLADIGRFGRKGGRVNSAPVSPRCHWRSTPEKRA